MSDSFVDSDDFAANAMNFPEGTYSSNPTLRTSANTSVKGPQTPQRPSNNAAYISPQRSSAPRSNVDNSFVANTSAETDSNPDMMSTFLDMDDSAAAAAPPPQQARFINGRPAYVSGRGAPVKR